MALQGLSAIFQALVIIINGHFYVPSEVRYHEELRVWYSPEFVIYRLISNVRRTSNITCTPTLGNSQLEFSPTISLAKTSITRGTPSFDSWVSIVDKVWSRPTWSELLRVDWDFDSPWITGHQSVAYVRHIILAPAANLCTLSAIVFLPIKAWIWRHLRRYIDGSAILLWLSRDPDDPDDSRFHRASRRKLCGMKRHFDKLTSVCDKLSIDVMLGIYSYDFTIVLPVDCAIKSGPRGCGKSTHNLFLHLFYITPLKSS